MVDVMDDSIYPLVTAKQDFIIRSFGEGGRQTKNAFDFEKLAIIENYIYKWSITFLLIIKQELWKYTEMIVFA